MKKLIIILMFGVMVLVPGSAFASEGLIKASSPVYFLQSWGEGIRYFFTFGKTKWRINLEWTKV